MYTYFITPSDVKDLTNISDNLSEKYILTAIREAQQTELTTVLGIHFITKLEEAVNKGEVPERYSELLDNYILYFLCYNVISKLIPIASVKIDNAGAITTGDEKVENLSLDEVFRLQDYYTQKSDYYKMRLQRYLMANRAKYPELDCTSEIHSAYSSPIFLGGKRGKHIIRPCHGCAGHISPKPDTPDTPEKPYYQVIYMVDGNVHDFDSYQEGERIIPAIAPEKDGYTFQYWEGLPEYMPANDITVTAVYQEIPSGVQVYYTLRYRVADWREDGDISFDSMAYIQEPSFEWLQCVEREYNPETREGWAKLTHANLRADTEIKFQKFNGYDALFMLDLSDFNNAYMTDRMFAENTTLREFYPPKGLIGTDGYDFYNCQYLTTINFVTADGYKEYQPYSYPMTGAFCNCVSLQAILADNQPHMHSHDGNLYNNSDELMAARYGEVVLKDSCTCIKSESLKGRGLTALTIPASVRQIEVYAISENMGLTDVYYTGTMQQWADIEKDDVNTIFQDTQVQVIHCSDGDCPIDYAGGGSEEPAEHKIDIFIEWDYLETRWFKVGDKIELPEPPVREGYTFVSWNAIVPGADWFDMPEYMPDYDFEVHASYSANTYKLTYKVDGEVVSETDVEYGTGIIAMEEPVKEGYTFSGWGEIPATMPAHDVEISGSFTINSYKLTYKIDGETIAEFVYEFGAIVPDYKAPEKDGYTFNGWVGEPDTMPAMDVTVTGSYTEAKVEEPEEPSEPEVVDYSQIPVTIEIIEDGDGIVKFMDNNRDIAYQYSIDNGNTWNDGTGETEIRLNNGEKAQFRNADILTGEQIGWFNIQTRYKVYGNIMSLIDFNTYKENKTLSEYANIFKNLFTMSWCVDASNLILPATTLSYGCYENMFKTCTVLTAVPELPATTLADRCYAHMFNGCEKLTTYPTLPATTLGEKCYGDMFHGCTSLTTAPELPATTLANSCYMSMFYGCTSLTAIPELPATTLEVSCCANMFRGCTSLVEIHSVLPATTLADNCYENMFSGCTSLTTAPELPATTLAKYCYQRMFNSCSKLKHITMLATDKSATNCLNLWVNGVASTGTFVKHPDMTSLPRGANGIPYNWTVEDFITELK